MKRNIFLALLILIFAAELTALSVFAFWDNSDVQDAVAINEAVRSLQADWDGIEAHENHTRLDYVVVNKDGAVIFKTKEGLSESLNAAITHRDTILDIEINGEAVGKIIVYNDGAAVLQAGKRTAVTVLSAAMLVQCVVCIAYTVYLNRRVIKPFGRLRGFAERIAGGNLDIPLEMDRHNLFGAFTESFDIMRSELKKARIAEAKANESKKELVAKLSHDIKTPVASIKAASEVGAALTADEKIKDNYIQIIRKADQINSLISNLFTATLEELKQLSVTPSDIESGELTAMLESADYLHKAVIPEIPDCLIFADRLRLQQVLDNIFANSYKYADTQIDVTVHRSGDRLALCIEDHGGGVAAEELPLIKEKFKRGSNAKNIDGAGLGLYISDYFMSEMGGQLVLENGKDGLKVTLSIPLSGCI